MKKLFVIVGAGVLLVSQACARDTNEEVSAEVKTAFDQKFPDAKNVKWEKESDAEWEADFKWNGTKYSAIFTTGGDWKETEHGIKLSEIPSAVKSTLDSDFNGFKVEESEIAETPDGTLYEFEVEKGEETYEVAIGSDGRVLSKEQKESEEGDED